MIGAACICACVVCVYGVRVRCACTVCVYGVSGRVAASDLVLSRGDQAEQRRLGCRHARATRRRRACQQTERCVRLLALKPAQQQQVGRTR
jgi:hypothetical protein